MSPDDPRHGTTAGYDGHQRDRTEPCAACRAAAAEYEYRRRIDQILGRRRTSPSEGTARRIQALVALGYTFGQIGAALGRSQDWAAKIAHRQDSIVRSDTATRVDELYRAWCMKRPDESTGRAKWAANYARTTARKNGWAPPLAWEDIDDPDEVPSLRAKAAVATIRERTWDSPDHRACPRCGVVRETYQSKAHPRGDLCRDCIEVEAA